MRNSEDFYFYECRGKGDPAPATPEGVDPVRFSVVLYAINCDQELRIEYVDRDEKKFIHTVHPEALGRYRDNWYLAGFSKEKNSFLAFSLHRITSVTLTGRQLKASEHAKILCKKYPMKKSEPYLGGSTPLNLWPIMMILGLFVILCWGVSSCKTDGGEPIRSNIIRSVDGEN